MFTITLDIAQFPVAGPIVKRVMRGLGVEIAAPITKNMRQRLMRARTMVNPAKLVEFDAYVASLDTREEGDIVTMGGTEATQQTGYDLEFGDNGMPYVPHVRMEMNRLDVRINAAGSERLDRLGREIQQGIKMTRKVV